MSDLERDAHAVLLPVAGTLDVEPWLEELFAAGTVSVLVAETREEYVARSMTPQRRSSETAADVQVFTARVRELVEGEAVVALDQEPWGTQRLHDLVPAFPVADDLVTMTDAQVEAAAGAVAREARAMGVTMFLSPVLDVLTGRNAWLEGRTLDLDHAEVGRLASAFVRGVQDEGVVAVAKHFPGFPQVSADPALHDGRVGAGESSTRDLEPFSQVVRAGVRAVMTGPAIVEDVDPAEPASTSRAMIELLRGAVGFGGLVVSDDLDAPATTRGRSVGETAVASLSAGADLLLVGGEHTRAVVDEVVRQAWDDRDLAARLAQAADAVRALAAG